MYIKLDKKLIVTIDALSIKNKKQSKNSFQTIHSLGKKLPLFHAIFKSLYIKNIIYNDEVMHFFYKDKTFYFDNDSIQLDAQLKSTKVGLDINIKQLKLKDFKIDSKGMLLINFKKYIFDYSGNFETFNIKGGVQIQTIGSSLYYRLRTQEFATLKPLMDFLSKKLNMKPIISDWIYKKIVASKYKLHYLDGKFDLKTLHFYPNLMSAKASASNVKIKFNKDVPAAIVDDLDLYLKNDNLIFDVKSARYEGKNADDTKVHIYKLMSTGTGIVVDINANTTLDDSIQKILRAFKINVPITQISGKTKTNIVIDIKFLPFGVRSYAGYFKLNDANVSLNGVPMYSKSGLIELDNGTITFKDVNIKYNTIFDIYTSGDLNLTSRIYKSKNKIKYLHVDFDEFNLLHVDNLGTTATMKIEDNGTSIYVDKLKTNMAFLNNTNIISVEDMVLFDKYSKLINSMGIGSGDLNITTKDFKNIK